MNGLLGLTSGTQDRQSAQRELAIFERMDQRKQAENQANMQAQMQEAQFFETMYQNADQLLDKDRKRINKRIAESQRQIRDHLSTVGGSRKDFYANGGAAILSDISNNILRSDEAIQYQENKKNLAKILEAKEKGMGHLLSPGDLRSVENYMNSEDGGAISYNGIMAEVNLPDSDLFDYGTEIPPMNILSHDSNMVKILGNYEMAYPDRPKLDPINNAEDRVQLITFMREMGYGGMGSNQQRMRLRAQQDKLRAQQEAKTADKSWLHGYTEALNLTPENLTVRSLNEDYQGGMLDELSKTNGALRQVLGQDFNERARRIGAGHPGKRGIGAFIDYLGQDMMGLRESKRLALLKGDEEKIANAVFGDAFQDGSVKNFTPVVGETYAADGTLIGDTTWGNSPTAYKGDYEFIGLTTAAKSVAMNGTVTEDAPKGHSENMLLVNAFNDNGTIDQKATDKLYKDRYGEDIDSEVALTTVAALRNANGDIIYHEFDTNKSAIQNALANSIAETNNITDVVARNNETQRILNQQKQLSAAENELLSNAKAELERTVFKDPMFIQESDQYNGDKDGQMNRKPLIKSFYMAADYMTNQGAWQGGSAFASEPMKQAIDQNIFTQSMIQADLEADLKDYSQGSSGQKIIEKWLEFNLASMDQNDPNFQSNAEFAMKWKEILGIL